MTPGRPLTKDEAAKSISNMKDSMIKHGWWDNVCIHCGGSCGGMLAEFGKPTPESLKHVICPDCHHLPGSDLNYDGNNHIRLEYVR